MCFFVDCYFDHRDLHILTHAFPTRRSADLGEALHAVLAYDQPERPIETRLADAQATLALWSVTGFSPKDAIAASDRLYAVLTARWPGAVVRREAPVVDRKSTRLNSSH